MHSWVVEHALLRLFQSKKRNKRFPKTIILYGLVVATDKKEEENLTILWKKFRCAIKKSWTYNGREVKADMIEKMVCILRIMFVVIFLGGYVPKTQDFYSFHQIEKNIYTTKTTMKINFYKKLKSQI